MDGIKLCECGCGEPAPIAKMTNTKWGHVKGQPVRFIRGHHNFRLRRPLADRFWEKVAKAGPDDCWEWTASCERRGYGVMGRGGAKGGSASAHRVSYELNKGPIPDGLYVCHTCDNPPCVNPAHLFLGTQKDNMMDARSKDRVGYGEKHWNSKLTEAAIRDIRASSETHQELADKYEVSRSLVSMVVSGRIWAHV